MTATHGTVTEKIFWYYARWSPKPYVRRVKGIHHADQSEGEWYVPAESIKASPTDASPVIFERREDAVAAAVKEIQQKISDLTTGMLGLIAAETAECSSGEE